MFVLHLSATRPYVRLSERRLQKYSVTTLIKFCFFSGSLCNTDALSACQYCSCKTSTSCIITVPYLSDFIYLPSSVFTDSDKSCNLHTHVVWFYVVSKGNGFWPDQKSCLILLKCNSGWQPTQHKPTWLFRCRRTEHTPDNLLVFSFCLCQRKCSPLSTRV